MLTERLKAVMEGAAHLSPEAQDQLAEQIADILDEAMWDAQFADPLSRGFFDELAAQANRSPFHPWPTPPDWTAPDEETEAAADVAMKASESKDNEQ